MNEGSNERLIAEEMHGYIPLGVHLVRTLRGHTSHIGRIAWSPSGQILASPDEAGTIRVWDVVTGQCLLTLKQVNPSLLGVTESSWCVAFDPSGEVFASGAKGVELWETNTGKFLRKLAHSSNIFCVAFDPTGSILAAGSQDGRIEMWEVATGKSIRTMSAHFKIINSLAFASGGKVVASASDDGDIKLWNVATGKLIHRLTEHRGPVTDLKFDPNGNVLASGSWDNTVKLWDARSGREIRTLEGHTCGMNGVAFDSTGRIMASKGRKEDGTIRLWSTQTGECIAVIPELSRLRTTTTVEFHPHEPTLATVGAVSTYERDRVINIWKLDLDVLLGQVVEPSVHYVNAKVVLVGDTGVGKSGLSLVLNNQPFVATESTPGRHVWTFDSREVSLGNDVTQTRETLLWDLAGQPGYRVIHQLHLNEVAVALVVFDARSETDPLAGVRHWERALRLAQQRQGTSSVPMKKFLVSARNDRGGVSIGAERLSSILLEFGFDGYFKTSAKEGWEITELRSAIEQAIDWENLPVVSSSQLFADIKSYLLQVKNTGQLLAPTTHLYEEFTRQNPDSLEGVTNLRDQFDTCIGRLENRDLIRRLTFGGYLLLQPELLDAYASAMVNSAKEEPDGLGSLAEESALAGRFFVPEEQKVTDLGQEQLLLHATVEELVRHDLALWENADDGRYLVYPSQFNRDYEDAPEPKGKTVAITFDGPVQSLYSRLAVRLGHSGLFSTGRAEMWRNAVVFTANAGGKCGLFLQEFDEARGRLILFFDELASEETRFHFEEYVLSHVQRRSLEGAVNLVRFFVCLECSEPVPDAYVKMLRAKESMSFNCPCGGAVSLTEPKERIQFTSKVLAMDISADRQRDFEAFVMSAKGETSTRSFHDWAGGEHVTLAIVFTDVVDSTAMGEQMRDAEMNEVRRGHFAQSRKLIGRFKGREVKTIGDSFMAAFKSVGTALDYAIAFKRETGHPQVQIRAGIHIGPMHVEEGDVFGGTVNFAARVIGSIEGSEIWLSERAKEDIDRLGAVEHKRLQWEPHDDVPMRGFPGKFRLWSLTV